MSQQSQVPGLIFSTVYATLGTSAIVELWRESWALFQNLPIPQYFVRFSTRLWRRSSVCFMKKWIASYTYRRLIILFSILLRDEVVE